ncbi:MAG TPA: hypothetical protein VGI33_05170 [Paenibacillus sp.]
MSFNQIQLYSEFSLFGKPYKIIAIEPPYVWVKRLDGEDQKYRFTELATHPTFIPSSSMKKERNASASFDFLSRLREEKREEVSRRYEIIRPLLLLEKVKEGNLRSVTQFHDKYNDFLKNGEILDRLKQETLIQRITENSGKSRATIMRYLSGYRKTGNEASQNGLVGLISDAGKGYTGRDDIRNMQICYPKNPEIILDTLQVRLSEEKMHILKYIIENEYLTKYRVKKSEIYESVKYKCIENQLTEVPYSTICNIIERIDEKAKLRLRNIKAASAVYDDVARGYADREALYPLDIVQIDHTLLDIEVLDDETGLNLGRPWITLGIDVYARMPWCLYVSFEDPSANVVRKAIQHGVFPKKGKDTRLICEPDGIIDFVRLFLHSGSC